MFSLSLIEILQKMLQMIHTHLYELSVFESSQLWLSLIEKFLLKDFKIDSVQFRLSLA